MKWEIGMTRLERRNMWQQRVADAAQWSECGRLVPENDLPEMRCWLRRLRDGGDDRQGAHSWIEVGWSDTADSAVAPGKLRFDSHRQSGH